MTELTRKQREVLEVILNFYQEKHYLPTLEEIAAALGIQTRSTIHKHVQTLIEEGYLSEGRGKRAYNLSEKARSTLAMKPIVSKANMVSLPLKGRIAAGKPIQAIEGVDEINPNELFVKPKRYVLEVKGESMIDIGVMDGDFVVVQHQDSARNGEIVVALVEREETTLKRIYYLPDGNVELRPENRSMKSMIYSASSIQVQGKMVGLFRNYA